MKLVAGFLITMTAVLSQAQTQVCTMDKVELEARQYIAAQKSHQVEFIQNCLQEAIKKQVEIYGKSAGTTTRMKVDGVLADIRQSKLAAIVKCESTNTPGCATEEEVFSEEERMMLDQDADLKRSGSIEGKDW